MARFEGITLKMTGAITAAVLGTAIALTLITSVLVSYTLRLSLKSRAVETAKILRQGIDSELRQLAIRTDILEQDEDFRKFYAVRAADPDELQQEFERQLKRANATMGVVIDVDGKAATSGDGAKLTASVAGTQVRALKQPVSTVETFGDAVYLLSAAPMKYGEDQTLAYLVLASPLGQPVLRQLREASGADLILVHHGAVLLSTINVAGGQALAQLDQQLQKDDLVEVNGLEGSEPLLASAIALRAADKLEAALVLALSSKDMKSLQRRMLGASLGLALLTMVLSGLLGLFIARRIADPIVEIEQSFREIAASGDLSRRITKSYGDEVGRMADSFNQMQGQIEQLHDRVVTAEQRMRDELKMASAVQEMLFPTTVVDGARCQIASHVQTSTETGGDWYAIIHAPERHLTTCIIADVTGHGAPAALVTAILHGFFKATQDELSRLSAAEWEAGVQKILLRLNQTVIESTRRSLVCSLLILTFDHQTLSARYANAGHVSPVLIKTVDGKPQVTIISTPPSSLIGDLDAPKFVTGELTMRPEDMFLLYTDGLIECTNRGGEMYGFRRLRKFLGQMAHQDARTARDLVLKDALGFFGDMPNADDITVVVGRVR
jgi:serine phosphatase RsbU (regulator of sigma subunit)